MFPTDKDANYRYRADLLSRAANDADLRSAIKELCRTDIFFWINTFCWTFDPRPDNQKKLGYEDANMLLLTWEFQDDYINWLVDHIDGAGHGLCEKSRDMGISWITLVVAQWYWQFGGSGNDFKFGSRKSDYVDKIGDMDSLFEKIRYQIRRQPDWLLPKGFDVTKHTNFMNIKNPESGSTITGESNNAYFGTGGRKKAVFFDEFAKWENTDASAWQSASDVTDCKIAISSANGRNNHFYKLRSQKAGHIDVTRIHWTRHPLKDQEWYENEKKTRTKQDLAAEVDIDYTASISNKAWENFDYETHVTSEDYYNSERELVLTCDFNIEPMSWVVAQEMPPMTVVVAELVDQERTRTEYHAQDFCERFRAHKRKTVMLYGDASGRNGATSSIKSNYEIIKKILIDNGWSVQDYVPRSNPPVSERLNASNKRLKDHERDGESFVLIHKNCVHLIDSLEQSKRKGDGIDKTGNVEHVAEAWSYYEAQRFPILKKRSRKTKLLGV